MHGIIFQELAAFAGDVFGKDGWAKLQEHAGLRGKLYMTAGAYDDADILKLVSSASALSGLPAADVLFRFGSFLGPRLLKSHARYLQREWRTLDLLVEVENTMHRVVRANNKDATPPQLRTQRVNADTVVIDYDSPRKLCALARGLVAGTAQHFGDAITVDETACMHRGDDRCSLTIRRG